MSQVNDCILAAIAASALSGDQVNDGLLSWAQDKGATAGQLNDALLEALQASGATASQLNDAWYEIFIGQGYTGSFDDMMFEFWCSGSGSIASFVANYVLGTATPFSGIGTYTYSRGTASETIIDFEGLVKLTEIDEIGFDGQRRVENLSPVLDDYTATQCTLVNNGDGTYTVTADSTAVLTVHFNISGLYKTGSNVLYSLDLSKDSDNSAIGIIRIESGDIFGTVVDITSVVTDKLQRFASNPVEGLFAAAGNIGIEILNHNAGDSWVIGRPMFETVPRDGAQNPAEYVSKGVDPITVNGDFAVDDTSVTGIIGEWTWPAWIPPAGTWSIQSGRAQQDISGGHALTQGLNRVIVGEIYIVTYTLGSDVSYSLPVSAFFGGVVLPTTEGTHTVQVTAETTEGLHIDGGFSAHDLWVDDVSIIHLNTGSNIDGVKYFPYQNGNTVVDNVVSEAQGDALVVPDPNKGVNAWEARTNYSLFSEDLTQVFTWVRAGVSVLSENVTMPDGALGENQVVTALAANATLLQTITLAAAINTFSVYLQRKTGTGNVDITLDNGVTWTTVTLTGLGTWDRFDITGISAANPIVGIRIVTSGDVVYMWGGQLETGAFVTPYIPTGGATVTREADELQHDGDNYPGDQGSILVKFTITQDQLDVDTSKTILRLGDAGTSATDYFVLQKHLALDLIRWRGGGTVIGNVDSSVVAAGQHSIAISWDKGSGASGIKKLAIDGTIAADQSGLGESQFPNISAIDEFTVGYNRFGGAPKNWFDGNIQQIKFYNELLTNAQLEALTA